MEGAEGAYVAGATFGADGVNDVECVDDADGAEANCEDSPDSASGGEVDSCVDYTGGAEGANRLVGADRENREHDVKGAEASHGANGADGAGVAGGGGVENYGDLLGRLNVVDNTNCLETTNVETARTDEIEETTYNT